MLFMCVWVCINFTLQTYIFNPHKRTGELNKYVWMCSPFLTHLQSFYFAKIQITLVYPVINPFKHKKIQEIIYKNRYI